MLSLHPRYPVLKVPAPARLSAAVAQGLMMPEGGPLWAGNIGLHVSHTYLDRRERPVPPARAAEGMRSAGEAPCRQSSKGAVARGPAGSFPERGGRSTDDPAISFQTGGGAREAGPAPAS